MYVAKTLFPSKKEEKPLYLFAQKTYSAWGRVMLYFHFLTLRRRPSQKQPQIQQ